jgi:hypothetical protein
MSSVELKAWQAMRKDDGCTRIIPQHLGNLCGRLIGGNKVPKNFGLAMRAPLALFLPLPSESQVSRVSSRCPVDRVRVGRRT